MKTFTITQSRCRLINALSIAALLTLPAAPLRAADKLWSGGAASYTNAANWTGGVVPGVADKAINDNGTANAVQINVGDPDWILGGILAGRSTGSGAFIQNGQTVYITNVVGRGAVRLGVGTGRTGAYTINGGTLNYTGEFNVGELGTASLTLNGGTIAGSGNMAVNVGSSLDAVNATMDGGTNKSGHTWFEQGFYTADATRGLPPAGSTVVSVSQADHSYTMAPSYAANNAVFLATEGFPSATITLSSPAAATALSFLGSAGGGASTLNYTIHFSGAADESGSLVIPDWYPPGDATVAVNVGGRVQANGFDFQNVGGALDVPKLVSVDISLANTVNQITSLDLTYVSGGRAGLMAVSKSSGGDFTPLSITGYNADLVIGANESVYVANTVTNILTQVGGAINITGEFWVGNYGAGVFNFSGGTNNLQNWTVLGRVGGHGVMNMTGGVVNKTGNGNFLIGTGYQAPSGSVPSGELNQSGGMINSSGEFSIPENSPAIGFYNLSGNGVLNVNNWMQVGRSGGTGAMTMTGGTVTKTGGGNFIVGDNATGTLTQSAGSINVNSESWIGQGGSGNGTYDLSGGSFTGQNWMSIGRGGGTGLVNMTGGTVTKTGGGNFIVGDNSTGTLNQSAGTIEVNSEAWIGQSGSGNGTYNLSGGSFTVHNWIAVGRAGATGVINLTNGTINKVDNGNFAIGSGGTGTLNQYGGSISNVANPGSYTYLAEAGGSGTWNMFGGDARLGALQFCQGGNGIGNLYFNGGTITASEINCGVSGANGSLYFNGGTLRASADNVNFLHGLGAAYLDAGGAVIDSQGFNITIAQMLSDLGGGSLTKLGSGALVLSGANSFAGATIVNAGTLAVTTDSTAGSSGGYTVAGGAGLAVVVQADEAQLNTASLTFNSGATTLQADLGSFGNPVAAPINLTGALTVNGTVTVNLLDATPQVGQFPLIKYGSKSGAGSFVMGSLPAGVSAVVVDNTGNNSIDIKINSVNVPRWEGLAGGNWDIGLTTNWINVGDGLPTLYGEDNAVTFDDNALGSTTVNLVTTVHPNSVTFNHSSLNYALTGSGKISGTTGLTKQGSGITTIANTGGNDYTGPTLISGGTLSVSSLANGGAPSAIGASSASAANLVIAGGNLTYTGPATAVNRGYSVQATNGSLTISNNVTLSGQVTATPGGGLVKSGQGQIAYTAAGTNALSGSGADYLVTEGSMVLDGSVGGQTNTAGGNLGVAGETANATIVMTNTTVTTSENMDVGIVANSVGTLIIKSNTTLNVGSWFTMGDTPNSVATVTMEEGTTVNVPGGRLFLCSAPGTIATLNINGGTINKNGDYFAIVNGGWNGAGARTGVVNQVSGTVTGGAEMWVGDGGGAGGNDSLGIYNLSGGSVTVNNWMGVGRDGCRGIFNMTGGSFSKGGGGDMVIGRGGDGTIGIFNLSAGTLNKSSGNPLIIGQGGGRGEFNQSGGTLTVDSEYWVGVDASTTEATNNISGTAVCNFNNWVSLGRSGHATVNFTGGTITKSGNGNFIVGDNGTSEFNQSGSTTLTDNNDLWIGQAGTGNGTFNLTNGTVTIGSWLAIGRESAQGVLNIYNGSMTKSGGGNISIAHNDNAHGAVNIYGGAFTNTTSQTWVGENGGNTAKGEWNMYGGIAALGVVHLANAADVMGQMTLNGGSLIANEISTGNTGAPQRQLDFNGGTLVAGADNANFIHDLSAANVQAGGAIIDSAGHNVSINQDLLDAGGGGGLTKLGNGTLNLNGVNTYTGPTLVSAGTLGGTGTIAGPVTVASGASLTAGASIGILTINNNLTLNPGSGAWMEISLDGGTPASDLVTGLTSVSYNGSLTVANVGASPLVPGAVFKLFNSASAGSGNFTNLTILPAGTGTFNPATGELTITSAGIITVNPVTLSGGKLIFAGAGGVPGSSYSVLTATNVATPTWVTNTVGVFDGAGAFSNAIPVNPSESERYFKVKVP